MSRVHGVGKVVTSVESPVNHCEYVVCEYDFNEILMSRIVRIKLKIFIQGIFSQM
jgi:hypothetical protein